MIILSAVKISYRNLMAVKLRSFLSILGIIIGVASVVVIFAIGKSAQKLILDQVKGVGSNLIAVLPGASDENGPPAAAFGISITTLDEDDLDSILDKKRVPEVEDASGYVRGSATLKSDSVAKNFSFIGTSASYLQVEDAGLASGRFFVEGENEGLSRVAVLGSKVAEELFPLGDGLGKKIKIKEGGYQIIGIFKERGSGSFGTSQDDSVFIPLKTAQKTLLGIDHLNFIRAKVSQAEFIEFAKNNIKTVLRENHEIESASEDDFSVRDLASAIKIIENLTNILRYFLLTIGSVSLLVGGVGIMNIMLISVNQRIREVGLRKAVGARSGDVMAQFLIESITVSLLGGWFGIVFGITISFLISLVAQKMGYDWQFLISIRSLAVAFLVSGFVGVIFGIYPARKASKISPMEALRYE